MVPDEELTYKDNESNKNVQNSQKDLYLPVKRVIDSKTKRMLLLTGISLCIVSATFSDTGLAPTIGRVAYEFNDSRNMSWYMTAELLSSSVFQLLSVRISDCFGRRNILLFGNVLLAFTSLMCGLSTNSMMFIICRVFQGCGVGICQTTVLAVMVDLFSVEELIRYQPLAFSAYGISSIIGPVMGGIFTDYLTWKWIFWIAAILMCIVIPIFFQLVDIPTKPDQKLTRENLRTLSKRIDPVGSLLATASVVLFLTGLHLASDSKKYSWGSPMIIGLLSGALGSIVLFTVFEKCITPYPLFPSRMIRDLNLGLTYFHHFLFNCQFILIELLIIIQYQVLYGLTPTQACIRLIPTTIVYIVTNVLFTYLTQKLRTTKYLNVVGNLFTLLGILLMVFVQNVESGTAAQFCYVMIYGIGIGLAGQAPETAAQIILQHESKELRAACAGLIRVLIELSSALTIAITLSLLQLRLLKNLSYVQTSQPMIYQSILDSNAIYNYVKVTLINQKDVRAVLIQIYYQSIKETMYFFLGCSCIGVVLSIVTTCPKMEDEVSDDKTVQDDSTVY